MPKSRAQDATTAFGMVLVRGTVSHQNGKVVLPAAYDHRPAGRDAKQPPGIFTLFAVILECVKVSDCS